MNPLEQEVHFPYIKGAFIWRALGRGVCLPESHLEEICRKHPEAQPHLGEGLLASHLWRHFLGRDHEALKGPVSGVVSRDPELARGYHRVTASARAKLGWDEELWGHAVR